MKRIAGFVVCLLLPVAAYCGEIQGKVSNAQGAAVAGASVSVSSEHAAQSGKVSTGRDGSFTFSGLAPGVYTVTVSIANGQQILRREVSVSAESATVRADFRAPAPAAQQLSGAEERNPNIFIYRIDLNDLRNRLTTQRGPDPTYIPELKPSDNYFGAEFGTPLLAFEGIRPRALLSQWHGSLSALNQNNIWNARNFFNVGPLKAARTTTYDAAAEGPLVRDKVSLLLDFGQTFTSGWVNGNVQAPLASERTPTSTDANVNAVIADLLKAFPADLPNLPNVSKRQLNTNATRDIAAANAQARLDLKLSEQTTAAVRYLVNDYNEDPFQIILGQNPQTELRSQGLYTNLVHVFSPNTVAHFGFHYDRARARLEVTKEYSDLFTGLGLKTVPDIIFKSGDLGVSSTIAMGPGKQFPRFRVQNHFQYYADVTKQAGRHTLTAGWSIARAQVNDLQSDNARGVIAFTSDQFPGDTGVVDEVTNFLRGKPSSFTLAEGNLYRGFRNWEHAVYFGDQMRLAPTFSISVGARYELMTAPYEVNHLTNVNFPTDKNNIAPRFGFAWNPAKGKTTLRGTYGISYGSIFPVSYGMTRFNPPGVGVLQLTQPNLVDVINLLRTSSQPPAAGARSALFRLSPDLVFPYSHQYSFAIERQLPGAAQLTLAYIGMRSFHLLTQGVTNRAEAVPGVVATVANINQRRPDQRYFDINTIESNSNSYYDAVQIVVNKRLSHGLAFRAAYTFSKNIDIGGDFTDTASGVETPPETGTSTCEKCPRVQDQKGVSLFNTPNVFVLSYSYSLPFPGRHNAWAAAVLRGWQITGNTVFQSGTRFHFHAGSDAPGYGNVDGNTQDRPNILNPSILGKSLDSPDHTPALIGAGTCVLPTAAIPYLHCLNFDDNIPVGGRGNLGMNTFSKSATNNWNLAFGRVFRLASERSLQFRTEFYNLLNRAQFDRPGIQLASETFGEITNTTNKGRQIQFSLRLNF